MGNPLQANAGDMQGIWVPIPLDDFDWAPEQHLPSNQMVCRAASSSASNFDTQESRCAGGRTQRRQPVAPFQEPGDFSCKDEGEITLQSESSATQRTLTEFNNFEPASQADTPEILQPDPPAFGALGPHVISIKGGGQQKNKAAFRKPTQKKMQNTYGSTTECILQNLSMKVGNPSARCYANAPWRAFAWTCALLQETNTQPWGNLQDAVQESLELAEEVDIRQLPGLQQLWKKHDLNVQGDANHFVNSLRNLSQTRAFHCRYAEIKAGGYLTDHVQQPLLAPYPDDWPENTTFQDLINGWSNEGMGQYLMDDKPVLVTHVTRNTEIAGVATKNAKILNPYGTFTVPRSLDGFARTSSEFVPAALICHRGPSHEAGHYFAALIYRDLMWIADDGKPPMHLDHLTPLLASQITQLWAVHIDTFRTTQQVIRSLPPAEEPDFDPPLNSSPDKRPRLEQQRNKLHFGNVTNFGRQVIDWYWTRQSEVYIFVETPLDPQRHQQTLQYYTVRGRAAFPAFPNEDNSGTHGGIPWLTPPLWPDSC